MSRLSAWEQRTGPLLTGLALLSLLTLVVDAAWPTTGDTLRAVELIAWAAFVADYLVRLGLAEQRWRFVRTHPVDLFAVAVPPVRSLRLVAALARLLTATRRGTSSRLLATSVLMALTVVLAGASAALDVERDAPEASITGFDTALWWAVTTVTTVGYGDTYPVTGEGRVIAAVLMVVGIATFGAVTASVAANVLERDTGEEAAGQRSAADRLTELEATVARLADLLESERAGSSSGRISGRMSGQA